MFTRFKGVCKRYSDPSYFIFFLLLVTNLSLFSSSEWVLFFTLALIFSFLMRMLTLELNDLVLKERLAGDSALFLSLGGLKSALNDLRASYSWASKSTHLVLWALYINFANSVIYRCIEIPRFKNYIFEVAADFVDICESTQKAKEPLTDADGLLSS